MKAVAIVESKHWVNVWSLFRTADGLGFDKMYVVDLRLSSIPRMNRRKIDLDRPPHDKIVLLSRAEFLEVIPEYDAVSMELTEDAQDLMDYEWGEKPLVIVGPEDGNIPEEILEITDQVKVPMQGLVRCFNVACAGSIAMYDAIRGSTPEVVMDG